MCGRFSGFHYHDIVGNSPVAKANGWDVEYTGMINYTNSLNCTFCGAKFRLRCAASTILARIHRPAMRSIREMASALKAGSLTMNIVETGSSDGIFTAWRDTPGIVLTELFPGRPNGSVVNGIRCEDLCKLTFDNESVDLMIVPDVMEHVPDLQHAIEEIARVLKTGGYAVVTVPVDLRHEKSFVRAGFENGSLRHYVPAQYHINPIDETGSLVFWEFGRDFERIFKCDSLSTSVESCDARGFRQHVVVLEKTERNRDDPSE